MPASKRLVLTLSLLLAGTGLAAAEQPGAAPCGGDFDAFLQGVRSEALAKGLSPQAVDAAVSAMHIDPKVLKADRAQGVFAQDWREFAGRMVNGYRLSHGKTNLDRYASVLDKVNAETGVPGPVIASFWGLETDYGAVLGDYDTLAALATLAHDCRRPELFRPHLMAALDIVDRGYLKPSEMKGAWAGEIGRRSSCRRNTSPSAPTATATARSTCARTRPTSSTPPGNT